MPQQQALKKYFIEKCTEVDGKPVTECLHQGTCICIHVTRMHIGTDRSKT